ncbi:hypothetical protein ABW20_dc0109751 [Dactylellina cionopaga]|nr:hypothetical protein ABW20_dc0109751 [Dactylellina cionopaga]
MALILPTQYADFLPGQSEGCSGRLHFQASDSEGVVLSRRVQQPYKSSSPAARLSFPIPPRSLLSLPFSLFSAPKKSPRDTHPTARKPRRHSDSIPSRPATPEWREGDGLEDLIANLALDKKSRRQPAQSQITKKTKFVRSESDRGPSILSLSDIEEPPTRPTISDWDSVTPYKTAPNRYYGSGTSSGISRQSKKSTSSGRNQQGHGGFRSGGGGGPPGGNNGSPPSLPQPIDPPPSDGKKYYACWFWLFDPVKYHACAEIRKESHHLKHMHLPLHFPGGLPSELNKRMNYETVWQILFPEYELPEIRDRDEMLYLMAQRYQTSGTAPQQVLRREGGLMSPESTPSRRRPGYESNHLTTPSTSFQGYHSQPSSGNRRASIQYSQSNNFDSSTHSNRGTSSDADSWYGAEFSRYNDFIPSHPMSHPPNEECEMLLDNGGIVDPVRMYMESDTNTSMSSSHRMEIDNLQRLYAPFRPTHPRIKIEDTVMGEEYFWDERHPEIEFDFSRFYLVYFADRPSGADTLISMRSLEALQKEYWHHLTPRAQSDGFVVMRKVYREAYYQAESARWPS